MKSSKRLFTFFLAVALVVAFVPGLWSQQQEVEKININKASVEELTQLKQIGPKYAERIVEYREAHGPFEQPEDVMKVPGIGPKTWEANEDCITVK
jgi:competence protein ComEA